jgi:hypothetical protein
VNILIKYYVAMQKELNKNVPNSGCSAKRFCGFA